jgi:hypothetical protein
MGLLTDRKLRVRPPRLDDPVFGELLFMYVPDNPKTYWEGEWVFPPTEARVADRVAGWT